MYYNRKTYTHENQGLMSELLTQWLSDKPKKKIFGNFRIEGNALVFRSQETEDSKVTQDLINKIEAGLLSIVSDNSDDAATLLTKAKDALAKDDYFYLKVTQKLEDVVSIKLADGTVLGNSSILPLIGRRVAYGNVTNNRTETLIQRKLASKVTMIPFSVFKQASLDIQTFKIIERGPEETVKRKVPNPNFRAYDKPSPKNPEFRKQLESVHFTGASLFKVGHKTFLFDLDRVELKHGIFNPFLSEIPKAVKSIAEAYEALKPKAVLDAEKRGLKVLRQGEWFFIPSKAPKQPKIKLTQEQMRRLLVDRFSRMDKDLEKVTESIAKPTTLRAGPNRPNNAECGVTIKGVTYVTGEVTHSGREHKALKLKGWYTVVPNTAIKSFQITGDID